jgi:4a-hydroxytetrahydrobiopterin dehydratase
MTTLSDEGIRAALAGLDGWEPDGPRITREYHFDGFPEAIAFVVRLSYPAEAADHHPDLDIRYDRVRVSLTTHSEGGVTAKDLDMARTVQSIAAHQRSGPGAVGG